ncbi:MAG: hypothetical protein ACYS0K_03900 [Planctomycetota bacterium]
MREPASPDPALPFLEHLYLNLTQATSFERALARLRPSVALAGRPPRNLTIRE